MLRLGSVIKKYIFERYLSSFVIASIDIAMSVVSIYLVLTAMRIVIPNLGIDFRQSMLLAAISVTASIISILIFKTNHRIIRHTSMEDVWHLAAAALLKQALFGATMLALSMHPKVVITIIILDFFVLFCAEVFTRIFMILVYDHVKQSTLEDSGRKRIFIYGSGDKSTALKSRLENSPRYKAMGFIQYGAVTQHATLQGLPLFSFRDMNQDHLQHVFNSYGVTTLLFPNYESLKGERERLVTMCTHLHIKILVVPPIDEVHKGALPQNAIREIRIEDLLGRDEIKISMQEIVDKYPTTADSPYLLPIIVPMGKDERMQYKTMLHKTNKALKKVAALAGIPVQLTMYVARHSWASAAKNKNIPISVISEGMGHDSEMTTQIYLASLDTAVVDRANAQILKDL